MSLSKLQGPQAAGLLEPLLRETVEVVRAEAAAALLTYRPAAAELVVRAVMQSPDPGVRSGLANALGQTQSSAALPFLLELLGDATPRPRIVAIRYLAHVGTKQQLAVLKPILNDADIAVRVTAAGAIGRLLNKGDRQK